MDVDRPGRRPPQRQVREHEGRLARADRGHAHPLETCGLQLLHPVDVVITEDQQASAGCGAKPRRQVRVDEAEHVRDIPEAQKQVIGIHTARAVVLAEC